MSACVDGEVLDLGGRIVNGAELLGESPVLYISQSNFTLRNCTLLLSSEQTIRVSGSGVHFDHVNIIDTSTADKAERSSSTVRVHGSNASLAMRDCRLRSSFSPEGFSLLGANDNGVLDLWGCQIESGSRCAHLGGQGWAIEGKTTGAICVVYITKS